MDNWYNQLTNMECPICGKPIHCSIVCHKEKKRVCDTCCSECQYLMRYQKKVKKKKKKKKKTPPRGKRGGVIK